MGIENTNNWIPETEEKDITISETLKKNKNELTNFKKDIEKNKEESSEKIKLATNRIKELLTSEKTKAKYENYAKNTGKYEEYIRKSNGGDVPTFETRKTNIIRLSDSIPFVEDTDNTLGEDENQARAQCREENNRLVIRYKKGTPIDVLIHEITHYLLRSDKTNILRFNLIGVLSSPNNYRSVENTPLFEAIQESEIYKTYPKENFPTKYEYLIANYEWTARLSAYRYELEQEAQKKPRIDINKGITKELIIRQKNSLTTPLNTKLPGILLNEHGDLSEKQINIIVDYLNDTNSSGLFMNESEKHLIVQEEKEKTYEQVT